MIYRLLLALDILVAAAVVGFFLWGLSDGSIGPDNILLWLVLLAMTGGLFFGAVRLRAKGQNAAAIAMLVILALPAFLFAMLMAVVLIAQPRWN